MLKDYLKRAFNASFDSLNKFLSIILIITFIISLFIKALLLDLLNVLLIVIILFRMFTKNRIMVSKQNNIYLKIKKTILKPFDVLIKNIKDKDHVYKRCHKCKTILKLPIPDKRGFKKTKCPNCQKKMTIFTFKQVKIEVIKKRWLIWKKIQ